MPQKNYTPQDLRERLAYDPQTGALTWIRVRASTLLGKEAKCLDVAGYIQINLPGAVLKGHRIAWAIHYGEWPKGQIDHINGIRNDNRIANLRDVSNQINCQNQRNGVRSNKTGFIGVWKQKNKYRAKICHNDKQIHLGGFDTPEEAHAAYVAKKRELHEGNVL